MDCPSQESQRQQIATLLIAHHAEGTDWGYLKGETWSKRVANEFLLCCLLDYQMPTNIAWRNGNRLVKEILDSPDDIWRAITSSSESEWKSKHKEYRLHRFPAAHNRLWAIAGRICSEYNGDARRIWEGNDPERVLDLLLVLGAGDQLSRMIVGALRDCYQVKGETSDVKADVHVCRVLGRALTGEQTDPKTALELARQLHPPDPWLLDAQLWHVGSHYCRKDPACSQCYLLPVCTYSIKKHPGSILTVQETYGRR